MEKDPFKKEYNKAIDYLVSSKDVVANEISTKGIYKFPLYFGEIQIILFSKEYWGFVSLFDGGDKLFCHSNELLCCFERLRYEGMSCLEDRFRKINCD